MFWIFSPVISFWITKKYNFFDLLKCHDGIWNKLLGRNLRSAILKQTVDKNDYLGQEFNKIWSEFWLASDGVMYSYQNERVWIEKRQNGVEEIRAIESG